MEGSSHEQPSTSLLRFVCIIVGCPPAITDISFDVDGITIAKVNTKVEDTIIRTIVIGDAYLEKGKSDTRRTFLCLIGEKGKVLLTFFTDK